jgi:hypothetical protein|tara:strand:- start:103 stop:276 length:174 start_codon:yes stop_codon:yes gene_type:complete
LLILTVLPASLTPDRVGVVSAVGVKEVTVGIAGATVSETVTVLVTVIAALLDASVTL